MIYKKCGESFTLQPGKPGFANVCPTCTESPDAHSKKAELKAADQKAVVAAERAIKRSREEAEREKRELAAMGFEVDRRFRVEIPVESKRQSISAVPWRYR